MQILFCIIAIAFLFKVSALQRGSLRRHYLPESERVRYNVNPYDTSDSIFSSYESLDHDDNPIVNKKLQHLVDTVDTNKKKMNNNSENQLDMNDTTKDKFLIVKEEDIPATNTKELPQIFDATVKDKVKSAKIAAAEASEQISNEKALYDVTSPSKTGNSKEEESKVNTNSKTTNKVVEDALEYGRHVVDVQRNMRAEAAQKIAKSQSLSNVDELKTETLLKPGDGSEKTEEEEPNEEKINKKELVEEAKQESKEEEIEMVKTNEEDHQKEELEEEEAPPTELIMKKIEDGVGDVITEDIVWKSHVTFAVGVAMIVGLGTMVALAVVWTIVTVKFENVEAFRGGFDNISPENQSIS